MPVANVFGGAPAAPTIKVSSVIAEESQERDDDAQQQPASSSSDGSSPLTGNTTQTQKKRQPSISSEDLNYQIASSQAATAGDFFSLATSSTSTLPSVKSKAPVAGLFTSSLTPSSSIGLNQPSLSNNPSDATKTSSSGNSGPSKPLAAPARDHNSKTNSRPTSVSNDSIFGSGTASRDDGGFFFTGSASSRNNRLFSGATSTPEVASLDSKGKGPPGQSWQCGRSNHYNG